MTYLSIIIKADEKDLKNYIEVLGPLLLDFSPELIIINNQIDTFDIPYKHSLYRYSEDYNNFKEFCFASSLGQRTIIIEKGLHLFPEQIHSIMKELESNDYLNISFNLKTYLCEDKSLFFTREEVFVYNRGIKGFNKNIGITVEDLSLIDNQIDIETNIKKLLQGSYFNEFYLWHENYILKMPSSFQLEFYIILEKNKLFIKDTDILKLEDLFLHSKAKNQYVNYLTLRKLYRDNKNECYKKISTDIQHIGLTEKTVYYCWLLKDFITAKIIPDFINKLNENIQKALINHLIDNDIDAPTYIYNLIMVKNEDEIICVNLDNEFNGYLYIIKTYIDYMKDKSEEPLKKEKLLQVLDLYLDYSNIFFKNDKGKYKINYHDESIFIDKFNKAKNLLSNKRIEESISTLKNICTYYPEKTNMIYYYIQKLRCENKHYPYILSVCMITKDEEKNLDRCLSSLKPLVDLNLAEIIIVDTGSTDNTLQIAKQYTNNVFSYTWNNNFSKARNHSILFAQGEYIFIIDADEEFEETEINKIINEFQEENYKQYNTITVRIKSYTNIELTQYGMITQQRIFRNNEQFYYESSIHNQPVCGSPSKNLNIEVLHYGYIMTEDIREKKFKRTTTLLKRMLEKVPRNIYYRYQLSSSYSMYGDLKEALKQVDIFIRLIKENKVVKSVTLMYYNNAAIIYTRGQRYDDADTVINMALAIQPDYIDFIYYKAYILFLKNNYEDALIFINKFLTTSQDFFKLDVANNALFAFYSLGNINNMLRLFIISNYLLGRYINCLEKVYEIKDDISLTNCLHEIVDSYFYTGRYVRLAKFYKARIIGNKKMEFIFKYFLLDNLFNCVPAESNKCLSSFTLENIDENLIEYIKSKIKTQKHHTEIDSLNLISKYYMDGMDFKSASKIFLRSISLLKTYNVGNCSDIVEIRKMKIVSQHILHRTESFIEFSLLTTEELINIFTKYINICLKLINMQEIQFLEVKERLFVPKIIAAFNGNIAKYNAIQYLNDAIINYSEMGSIVNIAINILYSGNMNNKEHNPDKSNLKVSKYTQNPKIKLAKNEIIQNVSKINDNKIIKVLHGTLDLTNRTTKIAEALNYRDVYAQTLNYLPNYSNQPSDYELDITSFQTDNIKMNNTIDVASKLIPKFDIFHFHSFSSLILNHSDLIVLKELDKKMFMHFWGQDVRLYSKASKLNPYIKMISENDDNEILGQLKFFSRYINYCIISDYELNEYVKDYFENVMQVNLMIDLNKYKPIYENDKKRLFTIVHVSSSPELYGSKYILEAINQLKLKYDINFKLIQEISPENAIKDADLIIDQLLIGRYGQISVEAMALGKPVICWINDFMKDKYPKKLPIIIANPDNIKEKLLYVLNNRDMLTDLGIQGRHYVEKYHNQNTEILKLVELYKL